MPSERTRNVGVSVGSRTNGTVTNIQNLRPAGFLGTFDFVSLQNLSTFYTQKRSTGKGNKTGFIILKGTVHLRICMAATCSSRIVYCLLVRGYCVAAGVRGERAD